MCTFNMIINEAESASHVQTLAAAAFADGAVGTSVLKSLGTDGKYVGNIGRDLFRRGRHLVGCDVVPYTVDIPLTKKSGGFRIGQAAVVLPHELWQSLSQPERSSQFHEIFGSSDDWRQWWRGVEARQGFKPILSRNGSRPTPTSLAHSSFTATLRRLEKWGNVDCV